MSMSDYTYCDECGHHLGFACECLNQKCKRFNPVNLGKKTFWWRVRIFLYAPFWFLSVSLTKKSWAEFKHGLITHVCEFDRTKPEHVQGCIFYPCKHFGCNMVDIEDPWLENYLKRKHSTHA